MANSLGYHILSPATFAIEWNGNHEQDAVVEVIERTTHGDVDNHAAFGSFTVQPGFLPVTERQDEFLFIKGIPNERGKPYTCMEAVIEAWWSPATFGLVFLLSQPGRFLIEMGQPIAQMFSFTPGHCLPQDLHIIDAIPDEYRLWDARRNRPEYQKDLDYMRGFHADGSEEVSHIKSWEDLAVRRNYKP